MPLARILIVEDQKLLAEQMKLNLISLGYIVLGLASDSQTALEMAKDLRPDLILMDINLEGEVDGIETAKILKDDLDMPVVFITGETDEYLFERAHVTEPFGYIIKPMKVRELEIALRLAISHSRIKKEMAKKEQHLVDAQRVSMLGSWDWDIENDSLYWTEQMFKIYGITDEVEATYKTFIDHIHPDDRSHVKLAIQLALSNEKHYCTSFRIIRKDGEIRNVQAEGDVTFDENGKAIRMIGTCQDISAIEKNQNELWYLAHHDPLTGLPNRNLLQDRLNQAVNRTNREQGVLAVMLIDLDHFKVINDTLGHDVGDMVLKETSTRLLNALRKDDTIARTGGDEFVVVASGMKDDDTFKILAEKLLKALEPDIEVGENKTVNLSASIGLAKYLGREGDPELLIKKADRAMYEAKRQGKNKWCLFDDSLSL